MTTPLREAAKFLAGLAACETLGHLWLGIWGKHLLPMDLGWFTFTETMNDVVMVAWPVALCGLVWFAWLRPAAAERGLDREARSVS